VLVPCFLLFLCFRKVTQEIFSELDDTKAEPPIFNEASRRPKMTRRGARGQPHHQGARPSPWPRPPMVRAPWSTPDDAPSPIKSPRREKPNLDQFSRNTSWSAAIVDPRSRGSRSSSRHPAGEGNRHRRSSSSPCLPLARWVSSLPWTMGP
jgi:hypothetical protein